MRTSQFVSRGAAQRLCTPAPIAKDSLQFPKNLSASYLCSPFKPYTDLITHPPQSRSGPPTTNHLLPCSPAAKDRHICSRGTQPAPARGGATYEELRAECRTPPDLDTESRRPCRERGARLRDPGSPVPRGTRVRTSAQARPEGRPAHPGPAHHAPPQQVCADLSGRASSPAGHQETQGPTPRPSPGGAHRVSRNLQLLWSPPSPPAQRHGVHEAPSRTLPGLSSLRQQDAAWPTPPRPRPLRPRAPREPMRGWGRGAVRRARDPPEQGRRQE